MIPLCNWRGRPSVTHEVVVQLIGVTTTRAGLTVNAKLDKKQHLTNVKASAEEMVSVNL